MISLPVTLRYCAEPLPVAAGWIADAAVTVWLGEARRVMHADPHAVVRFYPLAVSRLDPSPAGAILTVHQPRLSLDAVFGPRVLRLGEAAPGVLIPVLSRLEPALTPEEFRRLFPWALHFLHPVLGLTGFDEADALSPSRLLLLPPVEQQGWFAAVPGPPHPPALTGLKLIQEFSLDEWMANEGGDIATDPPDLNQKPRSPGRQLLDRAAVGAGGTLAGMGAGILRSLGAGGLADRLGQWNQRLTSEINDRRRKELNRLLDQFEKDPGAALRHAIPLAGAEARRGIASQPGWTLGARSPSLNAGSQGQGPADVWAIDLETRLKLERRYREAAAQETAAGRYGRAAYIYGELLGHWNLAAQMLEKAGRWRDALRIYLDRLRSEAWAAACLENAGLPGEAAALYREAGEHEKAGDLLMQLGQEKAAREDWERALRLMSSPLEQAVMLEYKLKEPERAAAVLAGAWPDGNHASAAFTAHLLLLGRLERHGETTAILERLEQDTSRRLKPPVVMILALRDLFRHYPGAGINERAAALALQAGGEFLARDPNGKSAKQILDLLPSFAPGDRILRRDTQRFSLSHNMPAVPLLNRGGQILRPSRVVPLPREILWQSLASTQRTLSAAGWGQLPESKRPAPFRTVIGEGPQPNMERWAESPEKKCRMHHVLYGESARPVYYFRNEFRAVWQGCQPGGPMDGVCLAIGPASGPDTFLSLQYTATSSLAVQYTGQAGMQRPPRVLDIAPPRVQEDQWFLGGHGEDIWVAGASVACCVNESVEFQLAQLSGPVTALAVAPPVLPSQAIAVCGEEAVLLISRGRDKPLESVNLYAGEDRMNPPLAVFTRDGRAVIVESRGGVVYALRKSCEKVSDIVIPPLSGDLVSAAAWGPCGFALLTTAGSVLLYDG